MPKEYVATNLVPYAVLARGQCCNLKLQDSQHRVWLCRTGGGVTVESLVDGKWRVYDGGCYARVAKAP